MLASASVQEAHDLACIGHAATLGCRVPFVHFFDGFRTSHEINKIHMLSDQDLAWMLDEQAISEHQQRALSPDHPVLRGTAQNPDAFFQAREACNRYYSACIDQVSRAMKRFSDRTGRAYRLFDYVGHPQATQILVMMGSGAQAAEEAIHYLTQRGNKVGLIKVRLFRPFSLSAFIKCVPQSTQSIAVLDRTKEPGSVGEPLYQDVITALHEAKGQGESGFQRMPQVIGGRYGLSSKEFTPAMVCAIFDNLGKSQPRTTSQWGSMTM